MVSAKDVQALNARIEKINTDRTKAITQQEMLQKRLGSELAEYKEQFGVDLKANTLKKTKALISEEVKAVMSKVEEEYALKEKVVVAIERGDYNLAYELLGIELEEEEVEEQVEEVEEVEEELQVDSSEADEEDEEVDFDFGFDDLEVDEDGEAEEETEEEEETLPEETTGDFFGDLEVEDDEEEVVQEESTHEIKGSSVADAFSDLEVVEDDLPDLEEEFGFGDLKDAKFE